MKLSAEGKLRLAAKLAVIAGVGTVAGGAYAQESSTQLQGVQVTGSRIKQANLTGSSSVTVISDKELQLEGTVNVETLLNNIPQTFAGFSTGDSNGATGTATVNLRGLGPQETLVLIDGKRLMPGDPLQTPPSADLNFIPAALVQRIDVLSGGASAIYGSDAVAGVVNFVMKKDLQGFTIDTEASRTDHSDGTTYDTTLMWGNNFAGGKGNVTLYAGLVHMDGITENKRGYSACTYHDNSTATALQCAGSRVIQQGRFLSYDRYYAGLPYYGVANPNPAVNGVIPDNGETFNYAPYNYLQRPDMRYVFGGFAHDQINTHLDIYGSAMFMDNDSVAQVAPSGLFGTRGSVPCNSPLMSAADVTFFCTDAGLTSTQNATIAFLRRTPEIGPRDNDLRHDQFRMQVGAKGDIADDIGYDVSAQRGEVIYQNISTGYLNTVNAANALDVITGPAFLANGTTPNPLAGQPECESVYNGTDPACVPLQVFQQNSITPAAAKYITGIGESTATMVEQVVTADVNADLTKYGLKSPMAKNGIGLAGGFEYRTEDLNYRPDAAISAGTLGGVGGPSPAVSGSFNVHEEFAEISAPFIENTPGAKLLAIDGAYRLSHYSLAGEAHNYKGGLKYAPTSDAMFRASIQRATRAPSVSELFSPQAFGLTTGSDPCSGANPAYTLQECENTGVTSTQYGKLMNCNAGQCNVLTGGNTGLQNELSISRSAGIAITPTMVKNLSMSFDYFDITIRNVVGTLPIGTILEDCALQDVLCGDIHRGPTGGLSGDTAEGNYVTTTLINTALERTKGFDSELDYRLRLRDIGLGNHGQVVFNYISTYVFNESNQSGPGQPVYECIGRYGTTCGIPTPRYRHKFRVTWDSPFGLQVSGNWRYFGPANLDSNVTSAPLSNGSFDKVDGHLTNKQYFDLSTAYVLPITGVNLTLRAGISNLFGEGPPVISSDIAGPAFGNANTYPNVYDSLGRVIFVGATLAL
jgi:outer membrane receptor protein involved in Fe transport